MISDGVHLDETANVGRLVQRLLQKNGVFKVGLRFLGLGECLLQEALSCRLVGSNQIIRR